MAKEILRDVTLKVDGVDLSNHCQQVGVPITTDVQDVTGMKAKGKEKLLGTPDGQVTATLFQDFDDASVDAVLSPLVGQNTPFSVVVIPKNGVVSKNNPAYVIREAILPNYNPVSGSQGAPSTTDVTFENSGANGVERIIKPEELEGL